MNTANSKLALGVMLLSMAMLLTRGDLFAYDIDDFDDLDTNGDGLITAEELRDGLEIDLVTANSYVSAFDDDADGKLSEEEFEDLPN
ncbi:hypothetical protein ACROYT_G034294 [Oculina patagonica]